MPLNAGPLPPPGAAAATTAFDDRRVTFEAGDVQAAIERLNLALFALIAGDDAAPDIRAATSYVCNAGDAQTVISRAIADGARTLFLVGNCVAASALSIDIAERIDLIGAPGSVLDGDLDVISIGGAVRVDVQVTGTISDPHRRVVVPLSIASTAAGIVSDPAAAGGGNPIGNIVSLNQSEYDALPDPDPSTLYIVRG